MRTHESTSAGGKPLRGRRVAVLVTDGFEQVELTSPVKALKAAGAEVQIIAPAAGKVRGWKHTRWGSSFTVDRTLDAASVDDYDALVLPGGVMNPDQLRQLPRARQFARRFFEEHKPVAAICHGPQLLIDAKVVSGRRMTSYPSIAQDLINAGADWVDEEVVVDQGLVTSRSPDDLDAFNPKMVEEIAEGRHAAQQA